MPQEPVPSGHGVSFAEALKVWAKIGITSFGGPAGQIALMHRVLVDEKRWIGEVRFLHALNYCMLLPGPEATQLATYIGWLLHRTLGGVVAGAFFVLPGFFVILGLSALYAGFQQFTVVEGMFFGIKAAVLAIVVHALDRIAKRALRNPAMITIALLAFVAIFFFDVAFPVIVVAAAVVGFLGGRLFPQVFAAGAADAAPEGADAPALDRFFAGGEAEHTRPSTVRAIKVTAVILTLWLAPVAVLIALFGPENVYASIGIFFSKMAVVTFGGAYAVLAYVAQEAVNHYGWLAPGEMLDGLGLAETTPGPLILVTEFVGYLAAFRAPGALPPMLAGILGAVLTTWVTFVPCFLWIFLGAPYVERMRGNRQLASAFTAITAAVVGVVLNLAIWFALHVLFSTVAEFHFGMLRLFIPEWRSLDIAALVLAAASFFALFRLNVGIIPLVASAAATGAAYVLVTG
ncbi:MAG TPA: chromate efflux transporter [Alphaproteobacteria bacterium]|nr:chromate efflux transporter [Alphaproteobacteria bacterium]